VGWVKLLAFGDGKIERGMAFFLDYSPFIDVFSIKI